MIRVAAYSFLLGVGLAQQVSNVQITGQTENSITVSWDAIADWALGYEASVAKQADESDVIAKIVINADLTATFTDLETRTAYVVSISPYNFTAVGSPVKITTRTDGVGIWVQSSWSQGLTGQFTWPVALKCAYAFTVTFPCDVTFQVGAGSNQYKQSRNGSVYTVALSGKVMEHMPQLSWHAYNSACDLSDVTEVGFAEVAPEDAFETDEVELTYTLNFWDEWVNNTITGKHFQMTGEVPNVFSAMCPPNLMITIPCDATVSNDWQVVQQSLDEFDSSVMLISYTMQDIWQAGFGLQFIASDRSCNASASTAVLRFTKMKGETIVWPTEATPQPTQPEQPTQPTQPDNSEDNGDVSDDTE